LKGGWRRDRRMRKNRDASGYLMVFFVSAD
jgi:hypothetical protein